MSNFQLPIVTLINNRPSTTSLTIAEHFDKQHFHVIRDIENLLRNVLKISTNPILDWLITRTPKAKSAQCTTSSLTTSSCS